VEQDQKRKNISDPMRYYIRGTFVLVILALFFASCGTRHEDGYRKGRYSSVDDLKRKRIAVLMGSTHDQYARKNFPDATVLQYNTPSDMVLAVKSGKADAGIYSEPELSHLLLQEHSLAAIGTPLFSAKAGMAFHQEDDSLRLSFNRFLDQIRKNGIFDDMVNRWITGENGVMPTLPANPPTKASLVVGIISDIGLPFTTVRNNHLEGFNIELLDRFGAYTGKQIIYRDIEFAGIIAALKSRKIDMIGTLMAITEERSKSINFSDAYYEGDAKMFVLKKNIASPASEVIVQERQWMSESLDGIVNSFRNNIIRENRWRLILDGLRVTVEVSFLSALWGTALGGLICFMRMSHVKPLEIAAKFYIAVMRGTPVLVLLMLIFYVAFASVDIDPVSVAVIAFGLNFGAYASEIYRSGIESIDRGQSEAGIAIGFTKVQTFIVIILPQMVSRILPVYKGEFISLVKMTSIVGYIAVQDLTKASDIIRSRTFDAFFPIIMVAVLYYLISWALLLLIGYLEKTTNPRIRRRNVPQQA
jgi:polar amino acid transport system substrate-binding protein